VRIAAKRTTSATASYGTIINPAVTALRRPPIEVVGPPEQPTAVRLASGQPVRHGQILSSPPTPQLPHGLLARVVAVSRSSSTTRVSLKPVSIYEALPNASFDIPLEVNTDGKRDGLTCTLTRGVLPYLRVRDPRAHGSWNSAKVFGVNVRVGVNVAFTFKAEFGIEAKYDELAGLSCGISSPQVGLSGAIGVVPIYGGVDVGASADVARKAQMKAGGSVKMSVGATTVGAPPAVVWSPQVSVSSPSFTANYQTLAGEVSAGFNLDTEIGVGVLNVGGVHLNLGAGLRYTASAQDCRLSYALGQFAAGGTVGPYSISTPRSPGFARPIGPNYCAGGAPAPVAVQAPTAGSTQPTAAPQPTRTPPVTPLPTNPAKLTALAPLRGPRGYQIYVRGPVCEVPAGHHAEIQSSMDGPHYGGDSMSSDGSRFEAWQVLVGQSERSVTAARSYEAFIRCVDTSVSPATVMWEQSIPYTVDAGEWRKATYDKPVRIGTGVRILSGTRSDPCPQLDGLTATRIYPESGFPDDPSGSSESVESAALSDSAQAYAVALPSWVQVGEPLRRPGAACLYETASHELGGWFYFDRGEIGDGDVVQP
jgi:hypothetical protein